MEQIPFYTSAKQMERMQKREGTTKWRKSDRNGGETEGKRWKRGVVEQQQQPEKSSNTFIAYFGFVTNTFYVVSTHIQLPTTNTELWILNTHYSFG